ncbi:ParA family protein [Fusobacterium perfoetens]|uniref:ParA family protein n=1 Tax=Fusobacterium perfoetens TaxID=852 RepID=UPI000482B466|nr:ParA family protein [Fusobacterium perfoetens]MCI6152945.1 ParA family protein [Fusobacterium perfoetens]MDY3237357.1 ParA family protein [Fusobacterium perfoetens]
MDKNNGKVIIVKVNKGGVGKTFLTVQLGAGLASIGKKVLILTSDSQNNILHYTFKDGEVPTFKNGLKVWVRGKRGELIKLRENLFFIPLENSKFSSVFSKKLEPFLNRMREEYDYILIDSMPLLKIDSEFVRCADKIIIPVFCDRATIEGVVNVIEEAGIEKILAVVPNKYRSTVTQNENLEKLKNLLRETDILFPEPIRELSQVENLLGNGKTIWETKSKLLDDAKKTLADIMIELGE